MDEKMPARSPGPTHALTFPVVAEWRDSGNPDTPNETTLRGHAAVFNSLSEDLGGFRELIEPGAFRAALRKQPDVRLLFNHDPSFVLARSGAGSLELREDSEGLHVFARVDRRISWVDDLRTSMQRGDIDQMSFAFTTRDGGDDWAVTDDGVIVRTILADGVDDLFDTSVVTFPAYERTAVAMRSLLDTAAETGRVRGMTPELAAQRGLTEPVADEGGDPGSHTDGVGQGQFALEVARRKARARAHATPTKENQR